MNTSKSRTGRTSICEPGRNASSPIRSTTMPPFVLRTQRPLRTSPVSWDLTTRSQTRIKSARLRESTSWPSLSSILSRKTSISSPIFKSLMFGNSLFATVPSDLNPISTATFESPICTTRPLTISPALILPIVPE